MSLDLDSVHLKHMDESKFKEDIMTHLEKIYPHVGEDVYDEVLNVVKKYNLFSNQAFEQRWD